MQQIYSRMVGAIDPAGSLRRAMMLCIAAAFAGVAQLLNIFVWLGLKVVKLVMTREGKARVEFRGNGAIVTRGAILTRDGREYELLADVVTIKGGWAEGDVRGAVGSLFPGLTALTLKSPVAGVLPEAPVTRVGRGAWRLRCWFR